MNETNAAKVKICGIQELDLLKEVCTLQADYVGFVLANSRRRVTINVLKELTKYLKSLKSAAPLSAGVFVNLNAEELERIVQEAPLDIVQLHGQESPELCMFVKEKLGCKVAKVVSVKEAEQQQSLSDIAAPYADCIDILLLDTHDPVYGGGSGRTFNWDVIPEMKEWAKKHQIEFMVAGGLNPDNVRQLMEQHAPDSVDVSSGVETDGKKDINKIKMFIERVKQK